MADQPGHDSRFGVHVVENEDGVGGVVMGTKLLLERNVNEEDT